MIIHLFVVICYVEGSHVGIKPCLIEPNQFANLIKKLILCKGRLLTNFLCLPDRLICLSRIDQAERFA